MAPHGTRPSLPALFALAAALAFALLAGPACVPGAETPPPPTQATPVRPAVPSTTPPTDYGAYVGYGAQAVRRVAEFGAWLGRPEPLVGHAYLPGDNWSDIEGASDDLPLWADWRQARQDRLLVLNVPMLDRNEAHLPDGVVRTELAQGADGRYDDHFRVLADRLVQLGLPDAEIVLGWEMNGTTYTHRCAPDPTSWKRYWTRIVTAMRSVPGQHFRFDFTPTRGRDAVPWTDCYPGDRYVDVIGMDAYDAPRACPSPANSPSRTACWRRSTSPVRTTNPWPTPSGACTRTVTTPPTCAACSPGWPPSTRSTRPSATTAPTASGAAGPTPSPRPYTAL